MDEQVKLNRWDSALVLYFHTIQAVTNNFRRTYRPTLVERILYAAPAWWKFLSVAEKDRIESVVK